MATALTLDEIRVLYETSALPISEIAARADCSRGTLYNYIRANEWVRSVPVRIGRPKGSLKKRAARGGPVSGVDIVVSYPSWTNESMRDIYHSIACQIIGIVADVLEPEDISTLLHSKIKKISRTFDSYTLYRLSDVSNIRHIFKDCTALPHINIFKSVLRTLNYDHPPKALLACVYICPIFRVSDGRLLQDICMLDDWDDTRYCGSIELIDS